jgi:hypothetical protein
VVVGCLVGAAVVVGCLVITGCGVGIGAADGTELGCGVAMLGEAEGAVVGPCDVGLLEGIKEGASVVKTCSTERLEARHTVKR